LEDVEPLAISAQASLHLEAGPLWRVVCFDFGPDRPSRLLVAIHHLAVDGVSWRPLLEDLETAYQQIAAKQPVQLPAKTTSYKVWAQHLQQFAATESLRTESSYWQAIPDPGLGTETSTSNTEESAGTLQVSLTAAETDALLRRVPAAYNTQINDVLLTALARAWASWSGDSTLVANLEGHGREDLFEDVDLSRTVGWFTSIFPVSVKLPESGNVWQPGAALKSVKQQLRHIPQRGIGYGVLRYLSGDAGLGEQSEPAIVFNYLGQFDQVVAGSKLFRFAPESTGPWHGPRQRRRNAIELNSLVVDDRLELRWTYSRNLHSRESLGRLADEFLAALRDVIVDCLSPSAFGRTPSDYPLARFDQADLDRLTPRLHGIEDIYPLSPIQTLFYSAGPGAVSLAFDQWHCTLHGELDVAALQQAWHETVKRHAVLRTTIHGEGLREPVQMVHRDVRLPWTVEDWRDSSPLQRAERWSAFLKQDRAQPLAATEAPLMRFALARLSDTTWKFLWSVPALLLDGWSWPLVFRDASKLYGAICQKAAPELEPVRPYRDYVEWLSRQSSGDALTFWREALAGFREPTPLPYETPADGEQGERYVEHVLQLSAGATGALEQTARRLQLTLSTLVQGAWALLLNRQGGRSDVVFGAAFAGRPADLRGVESIVGPFVNNLPVRATVSQDETVSEFFERLHAQLLNLSRFQFTPLIEIQSCSEVPFRDRLFESLVVFQNYLVDDSARSFGQTVSVAEFSGPVHTNYPMMLLVDPGAAIRITLLYDRRRVTRATVERWGHDLSTILDTVPNLLDGRVGQLQTLLSAPAALGVPGGRKLRAIPQNFVKPRTEMEHTITGVWQQMFGLDAVSVDENFFDLGGHSLLLVQMHSRLKEVLQTEFPIVACFEYPTVRALAGHLDQPATSRPGSGTHLRDRAERQKLALAQMRGRLKR
jgi:non-ribosomal peptide synthase protein (TIGR01720 family)